MNKRKLTSYDDDGHIGKSPKCDAGSLASSRSSLRIITDIALDEITSPTLGDLMSSTDSETDSLFDEAPPYEASPDIGTQNTTPDPTSAALAAPLLPAKRTAPPIPGLFFDPSLLLPDALCEDLFLSCMHAFFADTTADQVMLFERAPTSTSPSVSATGLPPFLTSLLREVEDLLRPALPADTHALLFSPTPPVHVYTGPPRARQAIVNLYWPGEGITPHVDLLDRYGDGIVGVSFGSGCAMRFDPVAPEPLSESDVADREPADLPAGEEEACALYLPKGSVLAMTGNARYRWTHGIERRFEDLVEDTPGSDSTTLLERSMRLSVTFRWLLPGADVVGSAVEQSEDAASADSDERCTGK